MSWSFYFILFLYCLNKKLSKTEAIKLKQFDVYIKGHATIAIEINDVENEQISSLTFITVVPLWKRKKEAWMLFIVHVIFIRFDLSVEPYPFKSKQIFWCCFHLWTQHRLRSISIAIYLLLLLCMNIYFCEEYLHKEGQWTFFSLLH